MKKFTVQDAVEMAKVRLDGKAVCVDQIRNRSRDEEISFKKFHELTNVLVADTNYWNSEL